MDIVLKKGKYVLAVSGGVDSMVLLDILHQKPGVELIVAHFNHGIRPGSDKEEKLVRATARRLGLAFEAAQGNLGPTASEDTARKARYAFLESVRKKYDAGAIITAHHQDDQIETALLNIIRGTGRKGLAPMGSNKKIKRPLLNVPKSAIIDYAKVHGIRWIEDSTNQEIDYLRNYLRLKVIPSVPNRQKQELLNNLDKVAKTNTEIEYLIATISRKVMKNDFIQRSTFASLPSDIGNELVAYWLRQKGLADFNKNTIKRLAISLKTAPVGSKHEVYGGWKLVIERSRGYLSKS